MTESGKITFIWATEETGFRHLYLITTNTAAHSNGVDENLDGNESKYLVNTLA